jgi:hypothetical protein
VLASLDVEDGAEEPLDGDQHPRREIAKVVDVVVDARHQRDRQQPVVDDTLLAGAQHPDGAGPDDAPGKGRRVGEQHHVQRIIVAAAGTRREAVVEGKAGFVGEHPVQPEEPQLRVVLVLVARACGGLDHDVDRTAGRSGGEPIKGGLGSDFFGHGTVREGVVSRIVAQMREGDNRVTRKTQASLRCSKSTFFSPQLGK